MSNETRIPEALALLREKGWCKIWLEDEGRHCINGAILVVHGYPVSAWLGERRITEPDFVADKRAVVKVLGDQFGFASVSSFNDHHYTIFAD